MSFPKGLWGQLKEKSGSAYCYGLCVLGGVIDEGYKGHIKVILHNTGDDKVVLTAKVAFCQLVMLPTGGQAMEGGRILEGAARGRDGGVNREMGLRGNGVLRSWGTGMAL